VVKFYFNKGGCEEGERTVHSLSVSLNN